MLTTIIQIVLFNAFILLVATICLNKLKKSKLQVWLTRKYSHHYEVDTNETGNKNNNKDE